MRRDASGRHHGQSAFGFLNQRGFFSRNWYNRSGGMVSGHLLTACGLMPSSAASLLALPALAIASVLVMPRRYSNAGLCSSVVDYVVSYAINLT